MLMRALKVWVEQHQPVPRQKPGHLGYQGQVDLLVWTHVARGQAVAKLEAQVAVGTLVVRREWLVAGAGGSQTTTNLSKVIFRTKDKHIPETPSPCPR